MPLPVPLPHPPVNSRICPAAAALMPATPATEAGAAAAAVVVVGLTMADGVMIASMEKFSGFCPVVVMAATVVFCTVGVLTVKVVSCGCV